MTEEEFHKILDEKGYGQAQIREWEPNLNKEMHTHDKSAMALVTQGELTLVFENSSETFCVGQCCELLAGTVHTETTGDGGAITLLAYK